MDIERDALEELRAKYAEMLAMRVARGVGEREARARMARLAARHPGALREIDDLELDEIRRRIDALEAVLERGTPAQPWMEAVALFHELSRGALAAKRWLAGARDVSGSTRERFERERHALAFPAEAGAWTGHLEALARPPRGRVVDLVFARLAVRLGVPEAAARTLVFGAGSRARRRIQ